MVIDGDATSVEEQAPSGQNQPVWDFSRLHGFQFLGERVEGAEDDGSSNVEWRNALTLELDTRAARFHQAVDVSIVLASDGAIRWLGDAVAKLAAGSDLLAPRAILLVDQAMSEEAQRQVGARLELWLNATVQRLLGPLFALRSLQEGSPQVQELAVKIANALGVLEREPVRGVVRNLDQNARAILRRQGVRFGSYYLYVPSVLKPASRALALQLLRVQNGDEALSAAAQGLIPMASSGRTSAPIDERVDSQMYRVAGFRSCGDRVVRVDIVERLADMIRAGSTLRILDGSDAGPAAFQVSPQMTSLTGCSGESFASILNALGFESLTVPRSRIVWPAAPTPTSEVAAEAETVRVNADALAEVNSGTESRVPDSALPSAGTETPPEGDGAACDRSTSRGDEPPPETDACALAVREPPETEVEAAPDAAAPAAPGVRDPPASGGEDTPLVTNACTSARMEPTGAPAADLIAESAEAGAEAILGESASADAAVTASDGPPAPVEDQPGAPFEEETATVWRFARPPAQPRPRHARHAGRKPATETRGQPDAAVDSTPLKSAGADPSDEGHDRKEGRAPSEKPPRGRKRRTWDIAKSLRASEEKNRRDGRSATPNRSTGERPAVVDPMSPFAKLLELRSILESESKKRT